MQTRASRAIAGIQKNLSTVASIGLAGVTFTPTSLVALLTAYANLVTALIAVHAQLHDTVFQERTQRKEVQSVLLALQSFVANMFGPRSTTLADFGFTPRKVGVESAATRHQAVLKAQATRKARGTMGSKQKLAITGASTASPTPATPPATTNGTPPKA